MKVGSKSMTISHLKHVEKPIRPRSAYNYFFQAEREKILSGETADDISFEGGHEKCSPGSEDEVEKDGKPKPVYDAVLASTIISGKVSFSDLGKIIGRRWRRINVNAEDIAEYVIAAASDKARYQKEMIVYNKERKAAYKIPVLEDSQEQGMVKVKEKIAEDIRTNQELEQELIRLKNMSSENNSRNCFQQKTAHFHQQELGRRDSATGQLLSPFSLHRETASDMHFDSVQNPPTNGIPNCYRETIFHGNSSYKTVEMQGKFTSFAQAATSRGNNSSFFDGPIPYTSHEQTSYHQPYRHNEGNFQLRDGSFLEPNSQVVMNRNVQEITGYPHGRSNLIGQTAEESKMIYPRQSPNCQTHHTCNSVHSSRTTFDMQSKLNLIAEHANTSSGNSSRFDDGRNPYTSPEQKNYHQPTVEMQSKCSLIGQVANTASGNSSRFYDGPSSYTSPEQTNYQQLLSQANASSGNSSRCYHDGRIPCTSQEQTSYHRPLWHPEDKCQLGGGGQFLESNSQFCEISCTQKNTGYLHDRSALIGRAANESEMFHSRHSPAWYVPPSVSGQCLMQMPCPPRGGCGSQIYSNKTASHAEDNSKESLKEGDQSRSTCAFVNKFSEENNDMKATQFLHPQNQSLYNGPHYLNQKPANDAAYRGINELSTAVSRDQAIPCTSQEQTSYHQPFWQPEDKCQLGGGGPFLESNSQFCKISCTLKNKGYPHDRSALIGRTANESEMFHSRHSPAWYVPPSVSGQCLMQMPCPPRGGCGSQIYSNKTASHAGDNSKESLKEGDQSRSTCALFEKKCEEINNIKATQFLHPQNQSLYNGPYYLNQKPANDAAYRGFEEFSTPLSRDQAIHFQSSCYSKDNSYNGEGTPYDPLFGSAAPNRSFSKNEFEIQAGIPTGAFQEVIPQESNPRQANFGVGQPQSSNGIYQYPCTSINYANPDFNSIAVSPSISQNNNKNIHGAFYQP